MPIRTKISRGRGRPPSYDRERAYAAIDGCFLTRGFHGPSIDDLAAATAMNRPSLRAAFGDRRDMYASALDRRHQALSASLSSLFSSDAPLAEHLRSFYAGALAMYTGGVHGPVGCLAVCTATAEAYADPLIRDRLVAILTLIDDALEARFTRAVEQGELPAEVDPRRHARLAAAIVHSLAVRARTRTPSSQLRELIDDAITLLLGPAARAARSRISAK